MLTDTLGRKTRNFTLQWHLTHACDMHCAHCYDRSSLQVIRRPGAMKIIDQMSSFCERHGVEPSMSLSGGNPLFYPWFFDVYREVVGRGWKRNILGNPIPDDQLDELVAIGAPRYYQVSFEGLEEHNDRVRGKGAFQRAMDFLPKLRERGIRAIVMLTLTKDNVDQVIPLAELLEGKADRMTFNRLSQTGEGASLGLPSAYEYGVFMIEYMKATRRLKVLGYKDNLFNIYRRELGMKLQGGCTGFGCGAAFNFLALLPNGEMHACRKFPSFVGNIQEQSLDQIYDSPAAAKYRRGCLDCDGCEIRHKCGGCLAVTAGHGLDPFEQRDPHCFM